MVTRGAIFTNREKLQDLSNLVQTLIRLHEIAMFTWKIDDVSKYLSQADMDELISRYQELKLGLVDKFAELL